MNLRLALFKIDESLVLGRLGKERIKTSSIDNLVDLKHHLKEERPDIIVLNEGELAFKELESLYGQHRVPFYILSDQERFENLSYIYASNLKLSPWLELSVEHHRQLRLGRGMSELTEWLMDFELHVKLDSVDQFLESVSSFLEASTGAKQVQWLQIPRAKNKISKLSQLRKRLDKEESPNREIQASLSHWGKKVFEDQVCQVWRHKLGSYSFLVEVPLVESASHYLLLDQVIVGCVSETSRWLQFFSKVLHPKWSLALKIEDIQRQVYCDSLTHLYNQRYLHETLDKKIEECRRYRTPFSVLFIDIDHFKRVNDSLGHISGSSILVELAKLLSGLIRSSDYAFRYGGDEFILLLSQTVGKPAQLVAERIRQRVEEERFMIEGIEVSITVSIGLAFFPEHAKSAKEIIRIADEAMYYGKHKSRNIVYKAS